MHVGLEHYLVVSAILFCIGLLGVIVRRKPVHLGVLGLVPGDVQFRVVDQVVAMVVRSAIDQHSLHYTALRLS